MSTRLKLKFGSWEKPQVSGTAPSRRFAHSTVVVEDVMYVFGGSSYGENENTLYHNDMYTLKFGEMLSWGKVDQKGDVPSAREGAILISVKDTLYLYGGVDKEGATLCAQGIFQFNIATNTWSRHSSTGPAPKALSMSGVLCDNKMVTFGGVLSGKGCNSVHFLDLESLEWSAISTHNAGPKPRCDHSCAVVGQTVFVCAGTGSDELWFNDLHQLSVASLHWREVEQKGNPPSPRDYSTLVAINDWFLVMYGGSCAMGASEECFSDIHYIDITSESPEWSLAEVEGDQLPPSRYSHSMVVWKNKLCMFGGQDNDGVYNDVWTIEFTLPLTKFHPTPVPRHTYTTSVPVPAPRKTVQPSEPESVKPRDFEELRSTYLQRINEMFDSLRDNFHQLDKAREVLAAEREAFETEKAAHKELYEQQQSDLKAMLESHQVQNEEWLEKMRVENNTERKQLAEQQAALETAQAELASDREAFTEKSRKLDAIMKQVQGLQEP